MTQLDKDDLMGKQSRSPKYPSVSLGVAIQKAKDLYNAEKKHLVPRGVAVKAWGYKGESGRSLALLAAVAQYGLTRKEKGHIGISDDAFTIINAPDRSLEKLDAIERCAKAPLVFEDLTNQYPTGLPSDDTLKWYLVKEGFTDQGADSVIQCFRDTISFVEEQNGGYNGDDEDPAKDKIEVGDLVQWESQGAMAFAEPKKVTGISECGQWVFVEDSETGLPLQEVKLERKAEKPMEPAIAPPQKPIQNPPVNPLFQSPGPSLSMDIFGDNHIDIRLKREVNKKEWEKLRELFNFAENTFLKANE